MRALKWNVSHAVFVTEIDDEHKEIFEALALLQRFAGSGGLAAIRKPTDRLISCIVGHFAHEERLMRAARYGSLQWHKRQHDAARRRVGEFVQRIESGQIQAALELVEYLTSWLHNHTRLADRMMASFLRNQRRMGKITIRASTKPADACVWVDVNGEEFRPGDQL